MREYGFSLTRILPYRDRIIDSVLIWENTGQWKPVFFSILWNVQMLDMLLEVLWALSNKITKMKLFPAFMAIIPQHPWHHIIWRTVSDLVKSSGEIKMKNLIIKQTFYTKVIKMLNQKTRRFLEATGRNFSEYIYIW